MHFQWPGLRRGAPSVVATVAVVLATPVSAPATTTNYYGYNYLSSGLPGTGACSSRSSQSGIACDGWNNWDRSQVDKNSGDEIFLGFLNNDGSHSFSGINTSVDTTHTLLRVDYGVTTYNRTTCAYGSGASSYVQCRSIIF